MFSKISEEFVYQSSPEGPVACGLRTVVLKDGEILCTYMTQTKMGSNDFLPMAANSSDGQSWSAGKALWPDFRGKKSPFVSARSTPDGRVAVAEMCFDIAGPGETFWSDEAMGMKENKLLWCISEDGRSFPQPTILPLPSYGSAEQPGGLLVRGSGEMLMIYAPYPTIEKRGEVLTHQIVLLRSTDGGATFTPGILGRAAEGSSFAESWVVELGNGTLVAGSWLLDNQKCPDVYFLSTDGGKSFKGPEPMGFLGQTTSLTPYGEDWLLVPYNQRKTGTIGVWLALAKPDETGFDLLANQPVWEAARATLLLVFWCDQPDGKGIRYVRLQCQA